MNCPKCKSEIENDSAFCPECGVNIKNFETSTEKVFVEQSHIEKRNDRLIKYVACIIATIFIVVMVFLTFNCALMADSAKNYVEASFHM